MVGRAVADGAHHSTPTRHPGRRDVRNSIALIHLINSSSSQTFGVSSSLLPNVTLFLQDTPVASSALDLVRSQIAGKGPALFRPLPRPHRLGPYVEHVIRATLQRRGNAQNDFRLLITHCIICCRLPTGGCAGRVFYVIYRLHPQLHPPYAISLRSGETFFVEQTRLLAQVSDFARHDARLPPLLPFPQGNPRGNRGRRAQRCRRMGSQRVAQVRISIS